MTQPQPVTLKSVSDLGRLVRARREVLGMSLVDAAALCNVGHRFLFDLEHGKASIQMGRALHVVARLGIDVSAKARS